MKGLIKNPLNGSKLSKEELEYTLESCQSFRDGQGFFYLCKQQGKYTMGLVSKKYFNRFNSEWRNEGEPKMCMTRATIKRVELLLAAQQFYNNGQDINMQARAKFFLAVMKEKSN